MNSFPRVLGEVVAELAVNGDLLLNGVLSEVLAGRVTPTSHCRFVSTLGHDVKKQSTAWHHVLF